ncbi:hypothetical protein [Neobacillus mesonae]|uniref:hypothetical protein n=1 Tax=Neobacillus mesonae TaxID=1193713 RepID=UPI000836FA24|nr:hypothetical protein [Neobacillus mesonae]
MMYYRYLTRKEREKITEIEHKIKAARSVTEVQLYKEQIGLIMERICIRRKFELDKKHNE